MVPRRGHSNIQRKPMNCLHIPLILHCHNYCCNSTRCNIVFLCNNLFRRSHRYVHTYSLSYQIPCPYAFLIFLYHSYCIYLHKVSLHPPVQLPQAQSHHHNIPHAHARFRLHKLPCSSNRPKVPLKQQLFSLPFSFLLLSETTGTHSCSIPSRSRMGNMKLFGFTLHWTHPFLSAKALEVVSCLQLYYSIFFFACIY